MIDPGQYRTGLIKIGGTDYVPPKTREGIQNSVIIFLQDFENLNSDIYLKAIIIHFVIALTQPFYDGNKRTARLLMNFIFLQNNYPLFSIPVKIRNEYVKTMIKGYETLDINNLINLLANLIIKNLKDYNAMK